jgi:hypothetical protein
MCIYENTHIEMNTYMHTYMHTYMIIYANICTCIYLFFWLEDRLLIALETITYVAKYVCIHKYIYIYI